MGQARALVFDFNGTLSHDEPLLYSIYAELFAAHGRPLAEADYFGSLAGNGTPPGGFPSPSSPGPTDGRSSPCSSGPASRTRSA
jgi:hypothetical protein